MAEWSQIWIEVVPTKYYTSSIEPHFKILFLGILWLGRSAPELIIFVLDGRLQWRSIENMELIIPTMVVLVRRWWNGPLPEAKPQALATRVPMM
jgi:hypothetical protein